MYSPMYGDDGSRPEQPVNPSDTILDPAKYFETATTAAKILLPNNVNTEEIMNRVKQSESTIRKYFAVNYKSVKTKIIHMACPFIVKDWSRAVSDGQHAIPIENPNLPELYTPLVFLFLSLLLASINRGISGTFTFTYITALFAKFVGYIAFLVVFSLFLFFIVGMPNSYQRTLIYFADFGILTFYTAFVNLVTLIFPQIRLVCLLYSIFAAFFHSIRTLNQKTGMQSVHSTPSHTYSIALTALLVGLAPVILSERYIPVLTPTIMNTLNVPSPSMNSEGLSH